MKRKLLKIIEITFLTVCLLLSSVIIGACSDAEKSRVKIVCTIFPEYDWVREISSGVDGVSVDMLSDSGIDLHNYQPSVADIAEISTCDLFIYVGGESDSWVDGALENAKNKDRKVISLLDVLDENLKEEEFVEGMQQEEETDDGEDVEYDEHVWLSLKNASIVCEKIARTLSDIDSENAEVYSSNLSKYKEKLDRLDKEYQNAVDGATKNTLVFGDRFPFRYLVEDYKLDYYAAFVGCSAESEASFETIVFLAKKIDSLGLSVILTIEGNNNGIAETIKKNTSEKNQSILVMNSMQSVTKNDLQNGITYLSLTESNLNSLKEALK